MATKPRAKIRPLDRLGRWNGSGFDPVVAESVTASNVFVFSHGWGRGIRPTVDAAEGFLRVWDQAAQIPDGRRFDGFYGPLADAITARVPDAAVLAYTWIDESATDDRATSGVRSQVRTTANGQQLAAGIYRALATDVDHRIHLIGFSHGAKVVCVAATLLEPPPTQLTLLDSPEGTLPILGGALNDLSSYLRALSRLGSGDRPSTFVDNYPSLFGIRYGEVPGLGAVVDTVLDPENFPLEAKAPDQPTTMTASASAAHGYSWRWYVETARNPELDVGFAWSPMLPNHAEPPGTQHRQRARDASETPDPMALEVDEEVRTGGFTEDIRTRVKSRLNSARLLSTEGKQVQRGLFWRSRGDLLAVAPLVWQEGPDDATVRVTINRTERGHSSKGWTRHSDQQLAIPLGGALSGPMLVKVELESDEPAAVEWGPVGAIYGIDLPAFAEYRTWIYPLLMAGTATLVTLVAVRLALWRRR